MHSDTGVPHETFPCSTVSISHTGRPDSFCQYPARVRVNVPATQWIPRSFSSFSTSFIGLVKNQVETVCHTVFHLVKYKVETFTPTFQFVLHPARLLPHPQNIFTAAFPACPHAFCLPAGSGHPVRTISYNNLHRINLFQHPQPFVPYIDGCVIVPVHFVPAYGTIICPYIQRHLLTMPATGTYPA